MGKIFEKYPEQAEPADETVKASAKQTVLTKREIKALKMFAKQLKKCKKRWKQVEKLQVAERAEDKDGECGNNGDAKNSAKEGRDESSNKKTFLSKLGDVILKAFPSILRTVVKVAVTAIFSCKFKWRRSTV